MFNGTYDHAARAERYRKVADEYIALSEAAADPFLARITCASPRTIKTSPSVNCGHWSESSLLRWPPALICQGPSRSPITPASLRNRTPLRDDAHIVAGRHHSASRAWI
jgi:hypothetical protein